VRKPTPRDQTEWWVKKQVKKILEDTGWYFWMPSASTFGRSGVSDFLAIKQPKLFMAIETKYDDVVTMLQLEFLTSVHEAGHYAFLVDETNIDDLRDVLTSAIPNPMLCEASLLKWQTQIPVKNLDTEPAD
jgi:hypothetical protein